MALLRRLVLILTVVSALVLISTSVFAEHGGAVDTYAKSTFEAR